VLDDVELSSNLQRVRHFALDLGLLHLAHLVNRSS
jgi:hypothetical protein